MNIAFNSIIHLAGENVANARRSVKNKERILRSRVDGTRALIDYISTLKNKPQTFLCASAIGYYGNRDNVTLDDTSPTGDGFLAEVCQRWEQETQRLSSLGIRVVNLRFGLVLSPKGGPLHMIIPPFKAWLGGTAGNGQQYMSWISIRDLVEIIAFINSRKQIEGPVNIVSPNPVANKAFSKYLGKALKRPTSLRIPAFILRLSIGQMAKEILLSSIRATPKVLLDTALRFCIEGQQEHPLKAK